MDIGRPFKAVFSDPEWLKKMLIAAGINFVPFLGIALTGYLLEYQRNVAEGRDDQLPEWDRMGEYWVRGLQVMVAFMIYALPVAAVFGFAIAAVVMAGVGGGEEMVGPIICGVILAYGLGMVALLALGVLSVALMTHFNVHRRFGAFFEFGQMWRAMRSNAGMYFGALGMSWVVSMAMSMITTPISYGFTFAMFPFFESMDTGGDFVIAMAGMSVIYFLLVAVMIVLYTPAYHVMFHYLGQYMGRAYGFAPAPSIPRQAVPATYGEQQGGDDEVLPPPPGPPAPPIAGGPSG